MLVCMAKQPTLAPTTKVTGATAGAALSVLLVWILSELGVNTPESAQAALSVVLTFLGGWLPEERSE